MSMRRSYSRVQSFPSPDSNNLSPPHSNQLNQFKTSNISSNHLFKSLHASIIAHKKAITLTKTDAITPTTATNSDFNFIDCYLERSALLLDACNNIDIRLETIRSCLDSIRVALHYLEGEHEPSIEVLRRVAESLDFSRLSDKRCFSNMENNMPRMKRMKTFGRNGVSSELYKALTGSWAMASLAIGALSSATCFSPLTNSSAQSSKVEPWTMLFNEISSKMKTFAKKCDDSGTMEELVDTHLAAQALLRLISSWNKFESCGLRRIAVKAVAGELRRRKQELENVLPLLEEKSKELYRLIVGLRINMLGLVSKGQKEDVLELVKDFGCEERQMEFSAEKHQRGVSNWVRVKAKMGRRYCSLGRIGPVWVGIIKRTMAKSNSLSF